MKPTLTVERLREALNYNPATGKFTWLIRTAHRIQVGDVAGRIANGYCGIRLDGTLYYAHRLAFMYVNGEWPSNVVDHIDGNRQNNAWDNLRDVTQSVNLQNVKRSHCDSHTGLLGAHREGNKFTSRISIKGVATRLGNFDSAEQAHAAYIKVKRQLHSGNTL